MSERTAARMTEEEMYERYGTCRVKFISYYKFTFYYKGLTPDGKEILCQYGGKAEDIYKERVDADEEVTIHQVLPSLVEIHDGKILIEFYNETDEGKRILLGDLRPKLPQV